MSHFMCYVRLSASACEIYVGHRLNMRAAVDLASERADEYARTYGTAAWYIVEVPQIVEEVAS